VMRLGSMGCPVRAGRATDLSRSIGMRPYNYKPLAQFCQGSPLTRRNSESFAVTGVGFRRNACSNRAQDLGPSVDNRDASTGVKKIVHSKIWRFGVGAWRRPCRPLGINDPGLRRSSSIEPLARVSDHGLEQHAPGHSAHSHALSLEAKLAWQPHGLAAAIAKESGNSGIARERPPCGA
jgi:hypothetical protein